MTQFKNMLLAFDGSEDGMKALEMAQSLAEHYDASLTVIYVHDDPLEHTVSLGTSPKGDSYLFKSQGYLTPGSVTTNVPPIPEEEDSVIVEDDIPIHVINQAKGKLESTNLNVTYEKLTGKPVTEISNYAENHDIDLIVIGNRGISGFKKLVQGSVSQKVTNEANCHVFVVK